MTDTPVEKGVVSKEKASKIVTAIVFVLIVGGAIIHGLSSSPQANVQTQTTNWINFNSPVGNFEVSFPVNPEHQTTPINFPKIEKPVNVETYSAAQSDGITYIATFIAYPQEMKTSVSDKAALQGGIDQILHGSTGRELISSEFSDYNGHSAVDYLIHDNNGDMYYQGKTVVVGLNLYQLTVIYQKNNQANELFDKFVSSLKINTP